MTARTAERSLPESVNGYPLSEPGKKNKRNKRKKNKLCTRLMEGLANMVWGTPMVVAQEQKKGKHSSTQQPERRKD